MTRVLVLGGGAQGRVIASDLAQSLPAAAITLADLAPPPAELANLAATVLDASDLEAVARLARDHDLVVGALPSRLGLGAMRAAIAARRPMVDVSFSAENPLALDAEARRAGVAILPDCGLAPGLSHLLVGRFAALHGAPDQAVIDVGGVAQDRARPFGYVVTWSLDDLLEEYVRPARLRRAGRPLELPAFAELEAVEIDGVGTMEAFLSDGLRTLLDTHPEIPDLAERTLRWPGHAAAVRPLVADGTLVRTLRERCVTEPPLDLVVLVVRARWGATQRALQLVDRYDPATRRTAMARTTALTTAVVAQLVLAGLAAEPGVHPLERVARDPRAFQFVRDSLAARGVVIGAAAEAAQARRP